MTSPAPKPGPQRNRHPRGGDPAARGAARNTAPQAADQQFIGRGAMSSEFGPGKRLFRARRAPQLATPQRWISGFGMRCAIGHI
eukprot:9702876-Alexandrium_andersonii.AAC.1